jgi:thiamine transport system ATP-binding protein
MLRTVGLVDYADRKVHELSGGEQQRVALARTLAPSPRLILLDEPIGALDRTLREHLIAEMRDVFKRLGVTALYVTHDRDEAFAIADTVAVMNHGRLVRKGTPEEIWRDPQNEYVSRLLGFDAIVTAEARDGRLDLGWTRIAGDLPDGTHSLAIPAHAIVVKKDGTIEGLVHSVTYRAGNYAVEINMGSVVIDAVTTTRYEKGAPIRFEIDAGLVLPINA